LIRAPGERINFIIVISILSLILFASLAILQYELYLAGSKDGTVGSDSSFYYNAALNILESGDSFSILNLTEHASGYKMWGALILSLSPDKNVIWIKICNVFVLLHLLLSLYYLLRKIKVSPNISLLAISLISIDGIIVFTAIENLRDIIIMFLIVQSILIMEQFKEKKRINASLFIALPITIIILGTLRSFLIFYVLSVLCYYILTTIKTNILKIAFIMTVIVIGTAMFSVYFAGDKFGFYQEVILQRGASAVRPELAAAFSQGSVIKRLIIGSTRYLFLPSPFKYLSILISPDLAVYRSQVYLGFIGSFWELQSAFLWWLLLPLIFWQLLDKKNWGRSFIIALGIIAVMYMLMYGYLWGGEVAQRQRIPIHILGIILAAIKLGETKTKSIMAVYPLIAIPVFFASYYWGIAGN